MVGSKRVWLLVLALVALLARAIAAPAAHFSRLTINDGLSQSTVMSIAQGPRGFLWFGTQDGLNRYDGYAFKIFRPHADGTNSLPDNNVPALLADDDGYIWVGTNGGGLARLNTITNQVTAFRHDPARKASLAQNRITALARGAGNQIWIGMRDAGVDLYLPDAGRFRHYRSSGPCKNQVLSLLSGAGDGLWVGTISGLCRLDPASGEWSRVKLPLSQGHVDAGAEIKALTRDGQGGVWIGTDQGLIHWTASHELTVYRHRPGEAGSLSNNDVHALLLDNNGSLWVGTQHGLDRLKPGAQGFVTYFASPDNPDGLSGNSIGSIYQDDAGLIWVGTLSHGISKLNLRQEVFKGITAGSGKGAGLTNPVVWNITQDASGAFWIATESGLNRYDPASGAWRHFIHDPDNPDSLADNNVRDIAFDRRGRLWIATRGGGLDVYDPATGHFTHHRRASHTAPAGVDNLLTIQVEAGEGVWIGTAGAGLAFLDFATGRFTTYHHVDDNPASLPEDNVYAITPDGNGGYWIGTLGGLSHFSPATGTFKTWTHQEDDLHSLSNNGVGAIVVEPGGGLWVGTDIGLNHFDPQTGTFTRYTTADGLPNNFIYGILRQPDGTLWISTNRGLSHFDPAADDDAFKNYSVNDGLLSNEFNTGAYYESRAGELYFGSVNGLVYFDPHSIKPNPHKPPVVVTSFKVFGKPIDYERRLLHEEAIHLSWDDSYFVVEFAALDYAVPSQNRYAYKLVGFNDHWINSNHRRFATYTNLDGGHYILRVKASNNDGVWNEQGVAIPIVIASPPWATWWAWTLYVLALIALIWIFVRFYLRRGARAMTDKLRSLGRGFNKTLDLEAVMHRLLDGLSATIPYREAHALVYYDGEFRVQASAPADGERLELSANEQRLLKGLAADPRVLAVTNSGAAKAASPSMARLRDARLMIMPLLRDGTLVGAVMLYAREPGTFTHDRLTLAGILLEHASMAVQNAEMYSEIRRMAVTDDLTGLTNRREFFARAGQEYQRAVRYGRPLSCLMIDIDHFKAVNDRHGHMVGDVVLRQVAATLKGCLRETDLVARYGGEEFVALLPETSLERARVVANRLHAMIAEDSRQAEDMPAVTISVGLAARGDGIGSLEDLVEEADRLLYKAKEHGRNRVAVAEEA